MRNGATGGEQQEGSQRLSALRQQEAKHLSARAGKQTDDESAAGQREDREQPGEEGSK